MWRVVLLTILFVGLVGCGGHSITDRLNGVWVNPIAEYRFDFAANTMTVTARGKTTTLPMSVVTQDDKSVTVKTDGDPIVLMLNDDGTVIIMQAKKLPLQLKRQT